MFSHVKYTEVVKLLGSRREIDSKRLEILSSDYFGAVFGAWIGEDCLGMILSDCFNFPNSMLFIIWVYRVRILQKLLRNERDGSREVPKLGANRLTEPEEETRVFACLEVSLSFVYYPVIYTFASTFLSNRRTQ